MSDYERGYTDASDDLNRDLMEMQGDLDALIDENHLLLTENEEQRSRIAALEAVTEEVRSALKMYRDKTMPGVWLAMRLADLVDAPTSTVLDQMIREAKAEAWVELYSTQFDGIPGVALTSLRDPANPYRNGDA